MKLDLSIKDPTFHIGAFKLGVFIFGMITALILVELFVPKLLRGICRAAIGLGGIYLFAIWLS